MTARFLHCIPLGKPACDLLMLQGVTPAHKGLTPSGIVSCYTLLFNTENLYFQHFFRAYAKVCTCSCWAHTKCICRAGLAGFEPRILASQFSPRGHERSPKSAPQHAPTVVHFKRHIHNTLLIDFSLGIFN